jgi:hypothetical protein
MMTLILECAQQINRANDVGVAGLHIVLAIGLAYGIYLSVKSAWRLVSE